MASGTLPPGFPPVLIEGQWYWNGGISSNTPMWYVVDEAYRESALVLQVDVFTGSGHFPQNLQQVQERLKDIQYASDARFSSAHKKKTEELRTALRRLLNKVEPGNAVNHLTRQFARFGLHHFHLANST